MKKQVFIIVFSLFLFSCTSKTIYKKPKDLISKEQMIEVWTDLYIASAAKTTKTKSLYKDVNYVPFILEKHKIDSTRFKTSNIYYTSRIEEYEAMFEAVQKRLETLKKSYDKNAVELDSIIKANSNLENELLDRENVKN